MWDGVPLSSSEMPTQEGQIGIREERGQGTPLFATPSFITKHPCPFLYSKLKSWLFQQIPWVPEVMLSQVSEVSGGFYGAARIPEASLSLTCHLVSGLGKGTRLHTTLRSISNQTAAPKRMRKK